MREKLRPHPQSESREQADAPGMIERQIAVGVWLDSLSRPSERWPRSRGRKQTLCFPSIAFADTHAVQGILQVFSHRHSEVQDPAGVDFWILIEWTS